MTFIPTRIQIYQSLYLDTVNLDPESTVLSVDNHFAVPKEMSQNKKFLTAAYFLFLKKR
jgi:hypothetical protein